jgi:hypothetical protein
VLARAEMLQPRPPRDSWAANPVFQHIQAAYQQHHVAWTTAARRQTRSARRMPRRRAAIAGPRTDAR